MPAYCRAEQFPVWGLLLAEGPRRRWKWQLLPFVSSAAIRLLLANGYRRKSGERCRQRRRPARALPFHRSLQAGVRIQLGSVAWFALRSFLVREWSSHYSSFSVISNSRLNWFRVA